MCYGFASVAIFRFSRIAAVIHFSVNKGELTKNRLNCPSRRIRAQMRVLSNEPFHFHKLAGAAVGGLA
jgi:hypothetical protein